MTTATTLQPDNDMKRTHSTLSGHVIEYEASPELAAFLTRLEDMISDPKVHPQQMIGVAYSHDNPMLVKTMHPTMGVVTKEVFENPAYKVMSDLLFRKRVVFEKINVDRIAAKYTVTVAQAAEQLGAHENTIRKAIREGRLPSWKIDGQEMLEPNSIAAYRLGAQGGARAPQNVSHELDIVLGHATGQSLRVRGPTEVETLERKGGNIVRGRLAKWKRVVVLTTREQNKRAFVLEPADEESEIVHGPFYVRGRFKVVEKANQAKKAGELWDATEVA